jgi:hypothetical protein
MAWVPVFSYFNLMASYQSQITLMLRTLLSLEKSNIPASFNMCLVIKNCVTPAKVSDFSDHYLRNSSTLHIGALGYIDTYLLGHPVHN